VVDGVLIRETVIEEAIMELEYTYWKSGDGWYIGYLNDWPEHWTQGKDVAELEEMLTDLYEIRQGEDHKDIPERKIGKLKVAMA
jgi:predicted RNase H-like HicB family nuclease